MANVNCSCHTAHNSASVASENDIVDTPVVTDVMVCDSIFVLCAGLSYVLFLRPLVSPVSFPLPPCMFVSLCLSVLFPSCFLLCAFPSWSRLSSSPPTCSSFPHQCVCALVPHVLFVSSLLVFVWCPPRVPCVSGFGMFWDFDFCFPFSLFDLLLCPFPFLLVCITSSLGLFAFSFLSAFGSTSSFPHLLITDLTGQN